MTCRACLLALLLSVLPAGAFAQQSGPDTAPAVSPRDAGLDQLYARVRPSLVAVKYQWEAELGKQEIVGCGVVVRDDGLVMIPLLMVSTFIPDKQMKDFKIILPSETEDETEVDATFAGRDERSNVAFVQAKPADPTKPADPAKPADAAKPAPKWTPIAFKDVAMKVGEPVYGIGLLPKAAGYKAFLNQAVVSANLRGEIAQVLVEGGGLGNVGSPVFNAAGDAVGVVHPQEGQEVLLDNRNEMVGIVTPPHFFMPARFFQQSVQDPPTPEHPARIPWSGVVQMTGVNQQFAEFLGLKNQPAAQIGDVAPGTPAARAGIVAGNIVVKLNGRPLERGDLPEEIPQILHRQIIRMKVGDPVTFTILPEKGEPTKDVTVTLVDRPRQANEVDRYYAPDLGFVAREVVFADTYAHKLKSDAPGVVVDAVKRDGAAATAKLGREDLIVQLNGKRVRDLPAFKEEYESFRKDHAHEAVVLVVHRLGGREETINIEPPQSDTASPAAVPGEGGL